MLKVELLRDDAAEPKPYPMDEMRCGSAAILIEKFRGTLVSPGDLVMRSLQGTWVILGNEFLMWKSEDPVPSSYLVRDLDKEHNERIEIREV